MLLLELSLRSAEQAKFEQQLQVHFVVLHVKEVLWKGLQQLVDFEANALHVTGFAGKAIGHMWNAHMECDIQSAGRAAGGQVAKQPCANKLTTLLHPVTSHSMTGC